MEYSFSLTGIQNTNWIALHRRWNSEHSSIFMTPLPGGWPCQIGSSTNVLIRLSTISNMDRPQHSLSLVSRSPSAAMSACYGQNKASESNLWLSSLGVRVWTVLILSDTENVLCLADRTFHKIICIAFSDWINIAEAAFLPKRDIEYTANWIVLQYWWIKHTQRPYLWTAELADDGDHLERGVLGLQSLHQRLQFLFFLLPVIALCRENHAW